MTTDNDSILSVVVGTFNRLGRLRECINSIQANTSIPVKIFVSDAGSTDGTIDYLKEIESDAIRVILHTKKLGQAKAYNEIFSIIKSPYTCWLSDDNVIVNRSLETAVAVLNSQPDIGMVGLKVKDVEGPFSSEPYIGGISEAGILNVNQGVLRTEVLQRLGGFSEEFSDYGIDPDLTARVLYAGHGIVYTKQVAILHSRDWGESDVLQAQMSRQERYKALYRKKYVETQSGRGLYRFHSLLAGSVKRMVAKCSSWLNSPRMAGWARDWYNIILGRYISLLDPIKCLDKPFHLQQQCNRKTAPLYADRVQQEGR